MPKIYDQLHQVYFECHQHSRATVRYIECQYGPTFMFSMKDDGSDNFNRLWFIFALKLQAQSHIALYTLLRDVLRCCATDLEPALPQQITAKLTWLSLDDRETKRRMGCDPECPFPSVRHDAYPVFHSYMGSPIRMESTPPPSPDAAASSKKYCFLPQKPVWARDKVSNKRTPSMFSFSGGLLG